MVAFILLFLLALVFEFTDAKITFDSSFFWMLAIVAGVLLIIGELLVSKENKKRQKTFAKVKTNVKSYVITSKEEFDKFVEETFKEEFKDKED